MLAQGGKKEAAQGGKEEARKLDPRQAAVWQRFLANAQRRNAVRELDTAVWRCAANRAPLRELERALLAGGDPNAAVGETGRTALHEAVASSRSVQMVAVLVEHGADVDALDHTGATALHLAARGGCAECVEFLLQSAAEPEVLDGQGWTAAQAASRCQDRETRQRIRAVLRGYTGSANGGADDDGGSDGGGGSVSADGATAADASIAAASSAGSSDDTDAGRLAGAACPVDADAAAAFAAAAGAAQLSAAPAPPLATVTATVTATATASEGNLSEGAANKKALAGAQFRDLSTALAAADRTAGGAQACAVPAAPPPPPAAMLARLRELEVKRAERRALEDEGRTAQLRAAAWLPTEREDALLALRHNISLSCGAFNAEPQHARMFVVKSFTEDDVHKAMKYGIWTSLPHNNRTFSAAWEGEIGPVYFLFSVNKSGRFVGLAQMDGPLTEATFALWAKRKFMGHFKVKWLFVEDMPFDLFKHITLPNNEGRSMVWSRDGQELLLEQLHSVLSVWASAAAAGEGTSMLADWSYYELRERQMRARYKDKLAPAAADSSKRLLRGAEHGPRHGALFRHGEAEPHTRAPHTRAPPDSAPPDSAPPDSTPPDSALGDE